MRRNGHKITSGVNSTSYLASPCQISYMSINFENQTTISCSFSRFSRLDFYFRWNFNPKIEIPIGCFLSEYEILCGFRQDLYVFWAKNGFCNAKFSEFRGWWGWGWPFLDETPKRHILGRFHAFWAIMRADPFLRFVARRLDEKRDTTKSHRGVIFHLFAGNSPINQI